MSLRQEYNELFDKHAALTAEAQAAYDSGDRDLFRKKMDEARALSPQLDQMEADLRAMDRSAKRYAPPSMTGGAPKETGQLTRADLATMKFREINAAARAGRFNDLLTGKE